MTWLLSVVHTSHHVPSHQPQLTARRRLHAALTAGWQSKLILVSAPPGFGKTTRVADWIADFMGKQQWPVARRSDANRA
jgi:LuxR family maltose regulon positive regulatory protein